MWSKNIRTVALALSGGIDSAVSAHLLKSRGFDVTGVYFRCWDIVEETGHCPGETDASDARRVADHLGIGFKEVDFVKEYWNHVFMYMIESYKKGLTPNPDVFCNQFVKFGSFIDYSLTRLGADAIATGHYTQHSWGNFLENRARDGRRAQLKRAVDPLKDQTLFLCKISQNALQKTMFPIGSMRKNQVKALGRDIGLNWLVQKRSSRGICFVGKREFKQFIDSFLEPVPGNFVHGETGAVVGEHSGIHHYTVGQRSGIGMGKVALFVVHKNLDTQDIVVAPGSNHPMLYANTMTCVDHHFFDDDTPSYPLANQGSYQFANHDVTTESCSCPWSKAPFSGHFRFQHQMPLLPCTVNWGTENFCPSPFDFRDDISSRNCNYKSFKINYDGNHQVARTLDQSEYIMSCKRGINQSECAVPHERSVSQSEGDTFPSSRALSQSEDNIRDISTVTIAQPRRALTPGQFAVFYEGDTVVASAVIKAVGTSMFHQNRQFTFDSNTVGKQGVAPLAVFL